ncbi:MAG: hypothetical protein IPO81_13755 [Kouleothrix sp.]|nr:hypothetical protein [Kouleothrix sp.]
MDGVTLKSLTVDFHEPGLVSKLGAENDFGFWFQLSDDEKQKLGSIWGPANAQALNRYSYVQNNPLRWTDPSGHYLEPQKVDFGDWGYETVAGTPGTSYVDGQGTTVYADENTGLLYKINKNGQRERLYRVKMRGTVPGCLQKPCVKYVYEYDTGFQDFKQHADTAQAAWDAVLPNTIAGATGGCLVGGIASGPFSLGGCAIGAILTGAGAAAGTAAWASYVQAHEYKASVPLFRSMVDHGAPGVMYGPPKAPGS